MLLFKGLVLCLTLFVGLAKAYPRPGICGLYNLQPMYQWSTLQYDFNDGVSYESTNAYITGIEESGGRFFVSTPRNTGFNPATLSTIPSNASVAGNSSPLLQPYPDGSWHQVPLNGDESNCNMTLVSVHRSQVDGCNRLWLVDSGTVSLENPERICPAKIVVFNLTTNEMVKVIIIPDDVLTSISTLTSIVLDNADASSGSGSSGSSSYSSSSSSAGSFGSGSPGSSSLSASSSGSRSAAISFPGSSLSKSGSLSGSISFSGSSGSGSSGSGSSSSSSSSSGSSSSSSPGSSPSGNGSSSGCRCDFVYITDTGSPGIIVYNANTGEFYRIVSPYMYPDPSYPFLTLNGRRFSLFYGVNTITVSGTGRDRALYFQPVASLHIYSIVTSFLRAGPFKGDESDIPVVTAVNKTSGGIGLDTDPISGCLLFNQISQNIISTYSPTFKTTITVAASQQLAVVFDFSVCSYNQKMKYLVSVDLPKYQNGFSTTQGPPLRIFTLNSVP